MKVWQIGPEFVTRVATAGSGGSVCLRRSDWLARWKGRGRAGSKKHKRPLANLDLWKHLDRLVERHTVRFQWVQGHDGNRWNDACDRLAAAAIEAVHGS